MAAAVGPTRQDTYEVSVQFEDPDPAPGETPHNTGIWDKMSGGEVDSDESKYKPGGMVDAISLGGSKNTGNVTVSRLYRLMRDHERVATWMSWVGRARVTITKQPLSLEGRREGVKPLVYVGILKRVSAPDVDSESSNAGLIEIEVTVEGYPTSG